MNKILLHLAFGLTIATFFLLAPPSQVMAARVSCKNGSGVNVDPQYSGTLPSPAQAADLGTGWVRMTYYNDATSGQPLFDYNKILNDYHSVGVKVLLILDQDTLVGAGSAVDQAYIDRFGQRVKEIAQRHLGNADAYEIWNEEDLCAKTSILVPAEAFAALLTTAYDAIKQVDPGAYVISGGLASGDGIAFMQKVISLVGGFPGDAIGIHPYILCWPDPQCPAMEAAINGYKSAFPGIPLWVTEFGWETGDQQAQAQYLEASFNVFKRTGLPVGMWYAWSDIQGGFGLINLSGGKKLSYASFQKVATGLKCTIGSPKSNIYPVPKIPPGYKPPTDSCAILPPGGGPGKKPPVGVYDPAYAQCPVDDPSRNPVEQNRSHDISNTTWYYPPPGEDWATIPGGGSLPPSSGADKLKMDYECPMYANDCVKRCLNGDPTEGTSTLCEKGDRSHCGDGMGGNCAVDAKAWCSPNSQECHLAGLRCGICYEINGGGNLYLYTDVSPCPAPFTFATNPVTHAGKACFLQLYTDGRIQPPILPPGNYEIFQPGKCWLSPEYFHVDQPCQLVGSLACIQGGHRTLACVPPGALPGPLPTPVPTPPPANKGDLLNGIPVQGKWCAIEKSTPLTLKETYQYAADELCISGNWNGDLQLMPKSVQIPFAQDVGQYMVGILDREHFSRSDINKYYDEVMGRPLPFFQKAQGISPIWNLSGPINRLLPQLEQDRLRHEFLGYLCQISSDPTQGRIPKDLNTRYRDFVIRAPLGGSQVSPIGNTKEGSCDSLLAVDPQNPICVSVCDVYNNKGLFGRIGDVYAKKMFSQCKTTEGKDIAGCVKKAMYQPGPDEQAVWDRVPLFANEESKGQVIFEVCGTNQKVAVNTAVPQVFRLASASGELQRTLLVAADSGQSRQFLGVKPKAFIPIADNSFQGRFSRWIESSIEMPIEHFFATVENVVYRREVKTVAAALSLVPKPIRSPLIAELVSVDSNSADSSGVGKVLADASCELKEAPEERCKDLYRCDKCSDAQDGPPDTEVFVNYEMPYNDNTRGTTTLKGALYGENVSRQYPDTRCGADWADIDGCWKQECAAHDASGNCTSYTKVPATIQDGFERTVGVWNNVPFLISIWYQSTGGPFGVFNILRPYRPVGQTVGPGLFQPNGKPFAPDNTFLDTPGSDPVDYQFTLSDNIPNQGNLFGVELESEIWKLIYYKLGGVWNTRNWILQEVAPVAH